jgi:uncharacterized protein
MRIIDTHTHVGQVWSHLPPLSEEALLRWMDGHGVEQAVVLPLESPEGASFPILTRDVLAIAERHRDRLIPFACIDPRASIREEDLKPLFESYVERGARGFGEHKVGLPIDHPLSQRLYAFAGELGLPVLLHQDGERNTDRVGLPGLERMLREFPETIFIGHAPAWWSSISADCTEADLNGYPSGPVVPGGAADRLLAEYPNMWADLSAGSGARALLRDLKFAQAFLERHADRILFATDYLHPGQEVPQFDLFETLTLTPETREKIMYRNALRLLSQAGIERG